MRILDPEKIADIEDNVSLRMYRGKVPDVKELWHTKCTNALAKKYQNLRTEMKKK